MTQGKFFFNSKQTDCLHTAWLAGSSTFSGAVYCSLGVTLPELLVTHEEEQTPPGQELWLPTFRALYGPSINLLMGKKKL